MRGIRCDRPRPTSRPLQRCQPILEWLEDRFLPTVFTVTSAADSGPGSLRSFLSSPALQNGDIVNFALPNPSTINLTSALPAITKNIFISGPGASALMLKGNHTFRILLLQGADSVSGLTITGGSAADGGGINSTGLATLTDCLITGNTATATGGGIASSVGLTIRHCTISNNSAVTFGGGFSGLATIVNSTITGNSAASGGGIASAFSTLIASTISGNTAQQANGAGEGGGIWNEFNVTIMNCTIANNQALGSANATSGQGGGLFNQGVMTLTNSTISGNLAQGSTSGGGGFGGGISNLDGALTLTACTISTNTAQGGIGSDPVGPGGVAEGGGVHISGGAATLANCTIANNRASGGGSGSNGGDGLGAGVFNASTLNLTNCTVARNRGAGGSGTAMPQASGGIDIEGGTTSLQNTIVANNRTNRFLSDIRGNVTSASHNLVGLGGGGNVMNGVDGNIVGTDPKLGLLQNNGGPTQTMSLLAGSPAIDMGANVGLTLTTDQRGYNRFANVTTDIGAFEFQPIHLLAVGAGPGGSPEVKVYDASTGALRLDFPAYEASFHGGVRVAVADINGDGVPDIITAPGGVKVTLVNVNGTLLPAFDFSAGRVPNVRVFSGVDGSKIDDFVVGDPSFRAGLFVAAGDVDFDGKQDIIVAPDATGQTGHTQVSVFLNGSLINTGASLTPSRQFNGYDPGFGGGVRLAAADVNGDGFAEIITAPGIWSGPDIRIFDGKTLTNNSIGSRIGEFLAYDFRYFGGVFVAAGDLNGDGRSDIVTGTNGNGGPEVKGFDGLTAGAGSPTPTVIADFFAYDPAFNGGARVSITDANGDGKADIVTGAGDGGGPHVRIFDGNSSQQLQQSAIDSFMAFDPSFTGGVFVGAA